MEEVNTAQKSGKKVFSGQLTIGLDLGDRSSFYFVLSEAGEVIQEQKLVTAPEAMKQTFARMPPSRLAMETGTGGTPLSGGGQGLGTGACNESMLFGFFLATMPLVAQKP